jgi:hypothetical protein
LGKDLNFRMAFVEDGLEGEVGWAGVSLTDGKGFLSWMNNFTSSLLPALGSSRSTTI